MHISSFISSYAYADQVKIKKISLISVDNYWFSYKRIFITNYKKDYRTLASRVYLFVVSFFVVLFVPLNNF